jgi:hypothetical protein
MTWYEAAVLNAIAVGEQEQKPGPLPDGEILASRRA